MEPDKSERMNRIRKTTKRILAMPADVEAMPPNPKIPAMMAMMRNVNAQLSIVVSFFMVRHLFFMYWPMKKAPMAVAAM